MGSKGQGSSSTTESSPWKPAQGALENILNGAQDLFDKQGGINAEFIEKEIADLTPEMQEAVKNMVNTEKFQQMAQMGQDAIQQGMSGIGQASGMLGGLAQTGISSDDINNMAKDLYDSELVASQKDSLSKDIDKSLASKVQGINQQASGSGNMGSSRAGVAEGVAVTGATEALAQGSAAIENAARKDAYGQAIGTLAGNQQTALGAAGNLGQLGLGSVGQLGNMSNIYQQGLGNALTGAGILQNQQQNILNNKWFNATGQQNAGWNNLNNMLGIAGSIGGMGGTSTTTGSQGVGGSLIGAAGQMGSAALGAWMGKSDARLKDNVEVVKEAHTRVNEEGVEYPVPTLYKWDWNAKAAELFAEHKHALIPPAYGVLAQELEATGFEKFVEYVDTEVEGLDGKVRVVNYPALLLYVGLEKEVGE